MGKGGDNRRVTDQIPSDRTREEDRCREGKREGERKWEYICGGQCCETRQVAVTLKMTVIKVTVGRWIWWFWLANQSSVKRTTSQIQRPPDTFWLMPVPDKKGPLTVPPIKLGEMAKNAPLSQSTLIFLSFKPYISFYIFCPWSGSSYGYYWDIGRDQLISRACLCLRACTCSRVHRVSHTVFEYSPLTRINRSIGGQNTRVTLRPEPASQISC